MLNKKRFCDIPGFPGKLQVIYWEHPEDRQMDNDIHRMAYWEFPQFPGKFTRKSREFTRNPIIECIFLVII